MKIKKKNRVKKNCNAEEKMKNKVNKRTSECLNCIQKHCISRTQASSNTNCNKLSNV